MTSRVAHQTSRYFWKLVSLTLAIGLFVLVVVGAVTLFGGGL